MTKSKAAPSAAAPAKKTAAPKPATATPAVAAKKAPAKKVAAVTKAAVPAKKAASKAVVKKVATKPAAAKKAPAVKKIAAKEAVTKKTAPAKKVAATTEIAASRKAASIVKPAAAPKAAVRQPWSSAAPATLRALKAVYTALDDKKASDIRILHLGARSSLVDFYVIATSLAETHLRALHIECEKAFDLLQYPIIGIDRQTDSGWVVVDTPDIMVHVFTEEKRGHYALESNWKDAEIVNPALLPS
jgi:ribosome-associated protein